MTQHIPENHPRAKSLQLRERLAEGLHAGVVTETGLIAHGRGEAMDYLLGELTHPFAFDALAATSATLTLAKHPVISINGNVAALAFAELAEMQRRHPQLIFEVNIFHYSQERAARIVQYLQDRGLTNVLESTQSSPAQLAGMDSARKHMHPEGLAQADVVLVPLEDGDRCQALVDSGRTAIAIDLNPLSRSAQTAHITIVDELTRTLPLLTTQLNHDKMINKGELQHRLTQFDNRSNLQRAIQALRSGNFEKGKHD